MSVTITPSLERAESTSNSATNSHSTASILQHNYTRSQWRSRLGSGLRTALACAMVGCATLYSPLAVRQHLTYPAFSYVTVILITGEATLADTLSGAVCAIYGTAIGTLPAALALFMIRPVQFYIHTTVLAVTLSSLVVAFPRSVGLLTKRIALGQIVIIYTSAFRQDGHSNGILIPTHVAACTTVGAAASVLASVLPYPRLACSEVREKRKLYNEIVLERLRLLVDAFCTDNSSHMVVFISQAKSLTSYCTKLLQSIKLKQTIIHWERPPFMFLETHLTVQPAERPEAMELPLRGMQLALATTSLHSNTGDQKLKEHMLALRDYTILTVLQQDGNYKNHKALPPLHLTIPHKLQDLPPLFIIFCIRLLSNGSPISFPSPHFVVTEMKVTPTNENDTKEVQTHNRNRCEIGLAVKLRSERLVVALKWSLALGLAVLFGVLFSKDNGYWAGLTVAITTTPWREATFRQANARAQGTALGSVYGVLGTAISQHLMEVRFLVLLLPWVVLTSFLRCSQMYGNTGGIAAMITALIIIGRRNYGSPAAFTIARLTETFIGLCCSTAVELVLQPTRAAIMARTHLSKILVSLNQRVDRTGSHLGLHDSDLAKQVDELAKSIREADGEPDLWFLPFDASSNKKLHCSLSKMVDLSDFLANAMVLLARHWDAVNQETIQGDLEIFKKLVGGTLRRLQQVVQLKSRTSDIELGKAEGLCWYGGVGADECGWVVASFLQHSRDAVEMSDGDEIVLCISVVAFCMDGLIREIWELEKGILELVQWENPTCNHVNS